MSFSSSITSSIGPSITSSIGVSEMQAIFSVALQSSLVPEIATGSPAPTYTRATTATVQAFSAADNSGASPLILTVASGEARFKGARRISEGVWSKFFADGAPINTANTTDATQAVDASGPFGYMSEAAATNICLQNRDQTNVAWVKSNMTAAKDEVGIDGAGNSASSLVSTAANGTSLQTFVVGSAARATSFYLKRITGTGDIQITLDNGSTWATVTLTSVYQLFQATQTLANNVIGIRIVTSGDKIAIDYAGLETGSFATSPIEVTTTSVTRNADVLTYDDVDNIEDAAGTAFCEASSDWAVSDLRKQALVRDSNGRFFYVNDSVSSNRIDSFDGTNSSAATGASYNNVPQSIAVTWGDELTAYSPGTLLPDASPASYDGQFGAGVIGIGCQNNGILQWSGTIRNVKIFDEELPEAEVQGL